MLPLQEAGGTLIDTITCNAGRAIYIEHLQRPDLDEKAWNPCFYTPWVTAIDPIWALLPIEVRVYFVGQRQELCWFKLSGRDGRQPSGSYDDTDTRSEGSFKSLFRWVTDAG